LRPPSAGSRRGSIRARNKDLIIKQVMRRGTIRVSSELFPKPSIAKSPLKPSPFPAQVEGGGRRKRFFLGRLDRRKPIKGFLFGIRRLQKGKGYLLVLKGRKKRYRDQKGGTPRVIQKHTFGDIDIKEGGMGGDSRSPFLREKRKRRTYSFLHLLVSRRLRRPIAAAWRKKKGPQLHFSSRREAPSDTVFGKGGLLCRFVEKGGVRRLAKRPGGTVRKKRDLGAHVPIKGDPLRLPWKR